MTASRLSGGVVSTAVIYSTFSLQQPSIPCSNFCVSHRCPSQLEESSMASIRKASHAGSWYSKSSNKLSEELDEWLANVPNDVSPINNPNDTVRPPVKGARVIIAP